MNKKTTKPAAKPDGRSKKRPGVEEQAATITSAAIELFIEQGTRNTSIAQICARADVSKPTFYRCFVDKDELVSTLYHFSINEHVESLLATTFDATDGSRKKLYVALDTLMDAIFERAQLAQLLFREYSDPASPASAIIDEAFERIARKMERSFRQRNQRVPSRSFLKAMMSAFQWLVFDTIKGGLTTRRTTQAKQAARELAMAMMSQLGDY